MAQLFTSIRKKLFNTSGRGSTWMEAWKFSIYLAVPLIASAYYNNPERMKKATEYWNFVKYPANPVTGLREQIIQSQKQTASREEYMKQLELLDTMGKEQETSESNGLWKRIFGRGKEKE